MGRHLRAGGDQSAKRPMPLSAPRPNRRSTALTRAASECSRDARVPLGANREARTSDLGARSRSRRVGPAARRAVPGRVAMSSARDGFRHPSGCSGDAGAGRVRGRVARRSRASRGAAAADAREADAPHVVSLLEQFHGQWRARGRAPDDGLGFVKVRTARTMAPSARETTRSIGRRSRSARARVPPRSPRPRPRRSSPCHRPPARAPAASTPGVRRGGRRDDDEIFETPPTTSSRPASARRRRRRRRRRPPRGRSP